MVDQNETVAKYIEKRLVGVTSNPGYILTRSSSTETDEINSIYANQLLVTESFYPISPDVG